MPNFLDADEIEPTITRAGSAVVAIVFSKEQAARMAQERPQLFCASTFRKPLCAAASATAIDSLMTIERRPILIARHQNVMNSLAAAVVRGASPGGGDPDHAWPGELFKMIADVGLVTVPARLGRPPHALSTGSVRGMLLSCHHGSVAAWQHSCGR
jgi:hypothetical protein